MVGDIRDIITCTESQIEICMGYNCTVGRIFDFCMGLTTVQRYCAACDLTSSCDQQQILRGFSEDG